MSHRYEYENLRMGHLPKYWDAVEGKVVVWQPWLSTSYPLEKLLGTYVFVAVRNGEPADTIMVEQTQGSLALSLHAGDAMTWENVNGVFQMDNDSRRGTFAGLLAHGTPPASDPAAFQGRPRPNLRRFDLLTSYMAQVPVKGHALDVLDAVDENGNNYIAMMMEYSGKGARCISYMGKKQMKNGKAGLTEAERQKMGISIPFEEVEKLGKTA